MKTPSEHKAQLLNIITDGIASVLNGSCEEYKTDIPISGQMSEEALKLNGFQERPERDQNGWQYDWWQYVEIDGKRFVATGSGFYGGFSFAKEEE